ncbi:hypothetical protein RND71_018180 [Anisodus tanguticus]|uniref:Uncharacterized protein n=1 Tax=Anisodus tanguticus TaxID=243964 RepID=A0AAE1S267_9SOLA|nr:hypothetical protein RND71_018180 [Anisodus tanguticus]
MERDEVMHSEEIPPSKSETLALVSGGKISFQSSSLVFLGSEIFVENASRKEVAEASDTGFASPLMMNLVRGKELMHESNNKSMESIPDIVDVEPDSD